MPTVLSHVAIPLAVGVGLGTGVVPRRLMIAGVIASVLPDLDVIGLRMGIAYAHAFGHRGVSHSLLFAAVLAALACLSAPLLRSTRLAAAVFIGLCSASHGVLDMFTNGGLGVELWWPFSEERVFAASRVIEVSPLSLHRVFSGRGLAVLQSELLWVWLPAAAAGLALLAVRRPGSNLSIEPVRPGKPGPAGDVQY